MAYEWLSEQLYEVNALINGMGTLTVKQLILPEGKESAH